jgi:hypothetical protein
MSHVSSRCKQNAKILNGSIGGTCRRRCVLKSKCGNTITIHKSVMHGALFVCQSYAIHVNPALYHVILSILYN